MGPLHLAALVNFRKRPQPLLKKSNSPNSVHWSWQLNVILSFVQLTNFRNFLRGRWWPGARDPINTPPRKAESCWRKRWLFFTYLFFRFYHYEPYPLSSRLAKWLSYVEIYGSEATTQPACMYRATTIRRHSCVRDPETASLQWSTV